MLMMVYILLNHFITARGKVYICMLIHIYVYKMNNWQRLAIFDVLNELMCWMGWGAAQIQRKTQSCIWICLTDFSSAVNNFPWMRCRSRVDNYLFSLDAQASCAPCTVQLAFLLTGLCFSGIKVQRSLTPRGEGLTVIQLNFSTPCFGRRFWFSLMPTEKITITWAFVLLFFSCKLTKCLNVLSDLISVATKVQVTSCLIQNSASYLYLMHTQPLSDMSDWAPKITSDFWKNWAAWTPRALFR